jgi:hypothetical protein
MVTPSEIRVQGSINGPLSGGPRQAAGPLQERRRSLCGARKTIITIQLDNYDSKYQPWNSVRLGF